MKNLLKKCFFFFLFLSFFTFSILFDNDIVKTNKKKLFLPKYYILPFIPQSQEENPFDNGNISTKRLKIKKEKITTKKR